MNAIRVGIIAEQLLRRPPGGIGVYIRSLFGALAGSAGSTSAEQATTSIGTTNRAEVGLVLSRGLAADQRMLLPAGTPLSEVLTPHRLTVELVHRGLPVPGSGRARRGLDVLHAASLDLLPGNVPLAAFVHDTLWRSWPDAYTARGIAWHERALRRTIDNARVLLVPSEPVAAELVASGASAESIRVVGEGADHLPLLPREADTAGPDGYLLSVATSQPRKNLVGLLDGYRVYRSRAANPLRLVLVGPTGWGADLPPIPAGVEVAGAVTDQRLAQLYSGAAALVTVPLAEGYGLPVVEAWRAGTPVICSDGVPVALEHPDAVAITDALDADAIAQTIVGVLNDQAATQGRVDTGREIANRLTWATVAQHHLEAWTSVVVPR